MTQEYPAAEHRLAMLKAKDTRIAALEAENFRLKQSAIAAQAPTAPPNGVPDHVFKAINLAATAVYLDDSSDFSGALWGVIEALSPELYEAMRDNPHAGYQSLPDICPPTAMPLPVQAEPTDEAAVKLARSRNPFSFPGERDDWFRGFDSESGSFSFSGDGKAIVAGRAARLAIARTAAKEYLE